MSNLNLVIDSSFRPYSFEERIKPYLLYKEAYDEQETAYNNLLDKMGTLAKRLEENPDGKLSQVYQNYMSDYTKASEDFSKHGLSMSNKKALDALKKRYITEIKSIATADEAKQKEIKEQHDLKMKDPTRFFSRKASATPIEFYYDNPDAQFESHSGAILAKQASDAAKAISKELNDYIAGKGNGTNINSLAQYYGYKAEDIADAILNPSSLRSQPILNAIVENVINTSRIKEWADDETLAEARGYALMGLWDAIGTDKISGFNGSSKGNSTKSTVTTTESSTPKMPDLIPGTVGNGTSAAVSTNNSRSTGTSTRRTGVQARTSRYGKKKAYGGSLNVFAPGGSLESNPEEYEFKISPYLQQQVDQMSDAELDSFLTSQIGHYPESPWQADSALMAYDKKLVAALENQYLENLFDETLIVPDYGTRPVLTTKEVGNVPYEQQMWDKYKKYFYKRKDGHYALNNEGRKHYQMGKEVQNFQAMPYSTLGTIEMSNFRHWIDELGLTKMANALVNSEQDEKIMNLMSRITGKVNDATKATEFTREFDNDQLSDVLARLFSTTQSKKLQNYKRERDEKSGTYKFVKGEPVDVNQLEKKGVSGTTAVVGKHGIYLEITQKDGNKIYVPAESVNPEAASMIQGQLSQAEALREMKKNGQSTYKRPDGTVVHIDNEITRIINNASNNFVSLFKTTGLKKDEVKPDIYR